MITKFIAVLTVLALVGCGDNPSQPSNPQTDQSTQANQTSKTDERCADDKINELMQSANAGDAKSQLVLGAYHDRGYCGEQDLALAEEWYTKSANQNNTQAQMALGSLYASDEYHQKNGKYELQKAIEYLTKASQNNDSQAMLYLGAIYYEDKYQMKDLVKAKQWFEKSAQLGNEQAKALLVEMK